MSKNIWRDFAALNGMSQDEFFNELVTATMGIMSLRLDEQEEDTIAVTKGDYKLILIDSSGDAAK